MEDKLLPSHDRVSFILCEQVREEARGKIALLGVYTGGDVVVANPEEASLAMTLAWIFESGRGTFQAELLIFEPSGKQLVSKKIDEVAKKAENNMTLAVTWVHKGFQPGIYKAQAKLDDELYERAFRVVKGDPEAVAAR